MFEILQGTGDTYGSFVNMLIPGLASMAFLAGIIIFVLLIILVALYVYNALFLSTIAKKLDYEKHWLAWIPIANFFLYPIIAKKNWTWGFIILAPIANLVFYFIWSWNIFEQRKYPGWLCLFPIGAIIPVIGWLFNIASLVIWGIVAWKDK